MITYTLVLTQVLAAVCTNDRPYMTAPALMSSLQPVHILSPTPFSGGWAAGSVFRVAAEIAMDIINSDQLILPGLKLVSAWFDDEGNSDYTMGLVLDNLLKRNASWIGVGGTGNSGVCGRLGQFLPKFRKPQVSYGCASISLSDPTKYPGMVRMNTVESGMVAVLETMAHVYNWTNITMFQGNIARYGTLETQFLDHFKDKLSMTLEQPREPSFEDLYNAMVKLRKERRRIIILLGYQEFMLSALCAAYRAGMPNGVVWLSMGTYDLIQPDTLSAFTQKQPECDAASIVRYAEGFLFVGFTGKPPPRNMDDRLDCLPNFTSRSFRDVLVNHFEIGYPVGENMAPNWRAFANAIANGADGICVWAYLVRHMIGLNFTVEELEKPDFGIYEEMVRYIREDLRFVGAMGLIDFEGTDLPGQFALYQIQNASFDAGDPFAVVDDGNIIPIGNHKLIWGDGSINPGPFFPACPFKTIYVEGACKPCVIGEFFDADNLECIPCSMGKFSDEVGAIDCSLCAPGSSQNRPASTHCNPCSLGKFVNAFGATLCNNCSEGTYNQRVGSVQCDTCGVGTECDGGSQAPVSTEGYYLLSYGRAEKCTVEAEINAIRKSVCLGNESFKNQELSCAAGHAGPLCGACALHYTRGDMAADCQPCGVENNADVVRAILLMNAELLWTAVVSYLSGIFVLQALKDRLDPDAVLLRILFHWIAVCSVLQKINWGSFRRTASGSSFGDGQPVVRDTYPPFPSWIKEVVNHLFWAGDSLLEIGQVQLQIDCIADYLGTGTHNKILLVFAWSLVYPIMLGVWLLVLIFLHQTLLKLKNGNLRNSSTDNKRALYIMSVYLLWDGLTAKALSAMLCVTFEAGEEIQHVWLGDPRESCDDVARNAIAVSVLLVWSLGFPALLLILIGRNSDRLNDEVMTSLFGFFYRGLEGHAWWWELFVKRCDLLFVLVITHTSFVGSEIRKLMMYTIIAAGAWGVHVTYAPFLDIKNNLLDSAEQTSLFSRFYLLASLSIAVMLQESFLRIPALVSCVLAFCLCVFFLLKILLHIYMTKSAKIAFKLEKTHLQLQKKFGESPQGARKLILRLLAGVVSILSYADVTQKRLADAALHIQWVGSAIPLKIVPGELPSAGGACLRHLSDRLFWRAYGMENTDQLNFCFHTLQTIQQFVLNLRHGDIPTQPTVTLLALSLKHAKLTSGLYGDALARARFQPLSNSTVLGNTESADVLIEFAQQLVEHHQGHHKDEDRLGLQFVSGDDLYALLMMLEGLTDEQTLQLFATTAKILEESHKESSWSQPTVGSYDSTHNKLQTVALDSPRKLLHLCEMEQTHSPCIDSEVQLKHEQIDGIEDMIKANRTAATASLSNAIDERDVCESTIITESMGVVELGNKSSMNSSNMERMVQENSSLREVNSEQGNALMNMQLENALLSLETGVLKLENICLSRQAVCEEV